MYLSHFITNDFYMTYKCNLLKLGRTAILLLPISTDDMILWSPGAKFSPDIMKHINVIKLTVAKFY